MPIAAVFTTAAPHVEDQWGSRTLTKVWELVFNRYYMAPIPFSISRRQPLQRIEAIMAQPVQAAAGLVKQYEATKYELKTKYQLQDFTPSTTAKGARQRKRATQPKSCPVCRLTHKKPA